MNPIFLAFTPRYILLTTVIAATLAFGGAILGFPGSISYLIAPFMLFALLAAVGLRRARRTIRAGRRSRSAASPSGKSVLTRPVWHSGARGESALTKPSPRPENTAARILSHAQ